MEITEKSIVGDLVAENYKYALVFKQAKIDFCCNGNRNIGEACLQKNIEVSDLIYDLLQVDEKMDTTYYDFKAWPLDLLVDYIVKTHHRYVDQKIGEITPFLVKVARVHGERHPELLEVQHLFSESITELTSHMKKEENILFPYVQKMVLAKIEGTPIHTPFGTVENPINMMRHEHENEGERFRKIAQLTNDYTPPSDACNTYRVTFKLLQEFEEDLHKHIHLENNILFPKAIELESSFRV